MKIVGLGKREKRKAERREAILELAQKTFLAMGYDRTTMSGIADAMGGSKGTLWSYFDSKESLFEAVIDQAAAFFREDLVNALDPEGKPEFGIRRFAETFIRKITSTDAIALHRIIIGESGRFPELGRIFYARAPGVTLNLLANYISIQMEIGALRRDEPLKAADMLISLCDGGHHKRVLWGIEQLDEKLIAADAGTAADHFLLAYRPK